MRRKQAAPPAAAWEFAKVIAIPVAGMVIGLAQFFIAREQQSVGEARRHHDQVIQLAGEAFREGLGLINETNAATGDLEQPCETADLRALVRDDDPPWARPLAYATADHDCRMQLLRAVRKIDRAVLNTSWALGSMPIDQRTRDHLTVLTRSYFHPCADGADWATCGWRARALRLVHGNGLPRGPLVGYQQCNPLRDLVLTPRDAHDVRRREHRARCRELGAILRTDVSEPVRTMSRMTFCSLQLDLAEFTADAFEYRFSRELVPDGEREPGYRRLADRLRDAAHTESSCRDDLRAPLPDIPTGVSTPGSWPAPPPPLR
jgi:hypothetical protein